MRRNRLFIFLLMSALIFSVKTPCFAKGLEAARIYIEFNQTDNDLGFHVFADAEDWETLKIYNPAGACIASIAGKAGYKGLGLSELFFEGAEPTLDDFPLNELLARFPEGNYKFVATTVDGSRLMSNAFLSHAVPDGPVVTADVSDDDVVIRWSEVTGAPSGFPQEHIRIVGYQVIVDPFQVTLPAWSREVRLPDALVEALGAGEHDYEVLAIDASGNQTITAGSFELD